MFLPSLYRLAAMKEYILQLSNQLSGIFYFSIYLNSGFCFLRALIGYSISEYPALFTDSPPVPQSERPQSRVYKFRAKCLPGFLPQQTKKFHN